MKNEQRTDVLLGINVYNEQDQIVPWLQHWTRLVDDILVIDQESTDNTVQLIQDFETDCHIQILKAPRMGKCEPTYQAIQIMAAHANKWMLKIDADEYISDKNFNFLMKTVNSASTDHGINAVLIARKNIIDGRDMSSAFANQADPKGYDWQPRLCKGISFGFTFLPHTHPSINGKWILMDPLKCWIEHRRTFKNIVRSYIEREMYLTPEARVVQRKFIYGIAQMLGIPAEEVESEVNLYVKA